MKKYFVEIRPIWCQEIEAQSKKEAIEMLKDQYAEDFNFTPSKKEIAFINNKELVIKKNK